MEKKKKKYEVVLSSSYEDWCKADIISPKFSVIYLGAFASDPHLVEMFDRIRENFVANFETCWKYACFSDSIKLPVALVKSLRDSDYNVVFGDVGTKTIGLPYKTDEPEFAEIPRKIALVFALYFELCLMQESEIVCELCEDAD